jgi:hypothetical protein
MGQTSDHETLVIHQKMMPGNNPEDFQQHYDDGGSLKLHTRRNVVMNYVAGNRGNVSVSTSSARYCSDVVVASKSICRVV